MSNAFKHLVCVTIAFTLSSSVGLGVVNSQPATSSPQLLLTQNSTTEADTLFAEARKLDRQGYLAEALEKYQRVLVMRRQLQDKSGEAATLNSIGALYNDLRQISQARETLQQALSLYQELGEQAGIGETLNNIGTSYRLEDDDTQALSYYQQALKIFRNVAHREGEALALSNIGFTYLWLDDYPQALENLQQALAINRAIKNRYREGNTLGRIGILYSNSNNLERANEFFQQALVIQREIGNKLGESLTLLQLGQIYEEQENNARTVELYQQALVVAQEIKDQRSIASILALIAGNYSLKQNKREQAIELLKQALAIAQTIPDNKSQESHILSLMAVSYVGLGRIYEEQENNARAVELYQQALVIAQEIKDEPLIANILALIAGNYSLNQNKDEQAIETFQQALAIAQTIPDNKSQESRILSLMAGSYSQLGNIERSIEIYEQALALSQEIADEPAQLEILRQISWKYVLKVSTARTQGLYVQAKAEANKLIEVAQQVLNLSQKLADTQSQVTALTHLGQAYHQLNENEKALEFLTQAVSIARENKYLDSENLALNIFINVYNDTGDQIQSIAVRLRQLEIARLQTDKLQEATILASLGGTYGTIGDFEKSIEKLEQAVAIFQQIEPEPRVLQTKLRYLNLLALSYNSIGEFNKAIDISQQALQLAKTLEKPELIVDSLLTLARFYDRIRNLPQAMALIQEALSIAQEIKLPQLEAEALLRLSDAETKQGNHDQALQLGEKSLTIARQLENPYLEESALSKLGNIYTNQGNYTKALEFAQASLKVVQEQKLGSNETNSLTQLSQAYVNLGNLQKALETANQALTLARTQKNPSHESLALSELSQIYHFQGEWEKSIEAAQALSDIADKSNNFSDKSIAASLLSENYNALGQTNKVIAVAEPALTYFQKTNNRRVEAELLINLGGAYNTIGNYQQGLKLVEQGLVIAQELKNPALESKALEGLGSIYSSQNNYQKALELTQKSLDIAKQLQSPPLQLRPLFTLATIYSELGDYEKKIELSQQVVEITRQLGNRLGEGVALLGMGSAYWSQGNYQKTVALSEQVLTISQEFNHPLLTALSQMLLSIGYGELGNDQKALNNAQNFLTFARQVENPVFEKNALTFLGRLHHKFGRKQEAITHYKQALAITLEHQIPGAENAGVYGRLARVYRDLNQPLMAINYYKQYVNQIEAIRGNIEGLPPQLQKSFLNAIYDFDRVTISDIYRELAGLLLAQGRNTEAQQVLELLKVQEISDFIAGEEEKAQLPLTPQEIEIQKNQGTLIAFGQRVNECERQQCSQLKEMRNQRDNLNREFAQRLQEIEEQYDGRDPNLIYPGNFLDAAQKIVAEPSTILIYPLVLEDKIWIMWASQGVIIRAVEVETVGQAQVNATVEKFRKLLETPSSDVAEIKATGKILYDWLVKPIEAEIKANNIENLVFSLDRSTRYIPLNALFDGEQYLVENYNISTVISAGLTNMSDRLPANIENTPVLALGLSEAKSGFPALSNVIPELNAIVRTQTKESPGIFPGLKFLNQEFTWESLRDNLGGKKILHIATHGKFVPQNPQASYLLLGNGDQLPIAEINLLQNWNNTHLVVLSACETARGGANQNGIEIAGISSYFLGTNKAQAVIASLWLVNDASTSKLMQKFYSHLANEDTPTKIAALRQAQLHLLHGDGALGGTSERETRSIVVNPSNAPSRNQSRAVGYSHPYYWSPFILIGNHL
ncbi:tetratricopeptide repeat protein [Nodularia chucula]|uniref:tetratricopeptide repeat protein n=1 Tax=Nodularia chucula TaxID=3093667 RepID=UPI0039C64591